VPRGGTATTKRLEDEPSGGKTSSNQVSLCLWHVHFILLKAGTSLVKRCCLCACDLSKSKGQTHRKRLASCNEEYLKLQECFQETCNATIQDFPEFRDDSVLCYQCLQILKKLVTKEKEALKLRQQLSSLLKRFVTDAGCSRKRTVPSKSQTLQPKRLSSRPKRITDQSKVMVCINFKL